MSKGAGVSRQVRARCPTDWRLIYQNRASEVFRAGKYRTIKYLRRAIFSFVASLEIFVKNFIHKRTLAGAGYSGDGSHHPERNFHVQVFYIKDFSTGDAKGSFAEATLFRDWNFCLSAQVRESAGIIGILFGSE